VGKNAENAATRTGWEVYIIRAASGALYTGITRDLARRFSEHSESGGRGAKFFRFSAPEDILWREEHPDRSQASRREREIKNMTRAQKLQLIESRESGSVKKKRKIKRGK